MINTERDYDDLAILGDSLCQHERIQIPAEPGEQSVEEISEQLAHALAVERRTVVNRWLLRFDVKAAKEQYLSRRWSAESRAEFLLRREIEWPLSVDQGVWPSVFCQKAFESPINGDSAIEIDPALQDQCKVDLDRLRTYYDSHRERAPGGVFIAVELLSEKEAEGDFVDYLIDGNIQCGIRLEHTMPARPPDGSSLLGYDVADAGLVSGLANCGYTKEDLRDLAPVWAPVLNAFGLLTTLDDAIRFREVCDRRVPGHAPFWIYALWRLPIG